MTLVALLYPLYGAHTPSLTDGAICIPDSGRTTMSVALEGEVNMFRFGLRNHPEMP